MEKSRTYNVIRNVGFGMVYKVISILLPFILRTVMIYYMGIQYAGLNTLFSSVLQVLNMTELGFGSALTFSMYKPIAEGNNKKICELLNLYRTIYRILGMITLGLGLTLIPFLKYLIKDSCPEDINIYILYFIYLINITISYFTFAYRQALINAYQRNDIVNKIYSATYFVSYIFEILVIVFLKNYYLYIIFTPISTLTINILAAIFCKKMFPQISCQGKVSTNEKKEIFHKVKALVGHKIGGVILNSFDSIVISAFLGLNVVAVYGNYFYVLTAINGIIDVAYNAILASVGNAVTTENEDKIYSLFCKLNYLLALAMCILCVCLICLYQPFMTIWVGQDNMFPILTVSIIVLYFYSNKSRLIGLNFKDAAGMWNADFWKPYVGLVVNLSTNIVLVNIIGIDGVFLSTIFTMSGIYFPWETTVIFKYLFKRSSKKFVFQYLYYTLITMISCFLSFYLTNVLISGNSISILIIRAILALIIGGTLFLFFNIKNTEQKATISSILSKINKMKR